MMPFRLIVTLLLCLALLPWGIHARAAQAGQAGQPAAAPLAEAQHSIGAAELRALPGRCRGAALAGRGGCLHEHPVPVTAPEGAGPPAPVLPRPEAGRWRSGRSIEAQRGPPRRG